MYKETKGRKVLYRLANALKRRPMMVKHCYNCKSVWESNKR